MTITEAQFREHIEPLLPVQRGNVRVPNLQVLNAILYVAENGCKWRRLPDHFGPWHTIYMRMNRWVRNGVLDRVFSQLQEQGLVRIRLEVTGLDGTGARNKTDRRPSDASAATGPPRFIWLPRMSGRR